MVLKEEVVNEELNRSGVGTDETKASGKNAGG